MSSPPSASSSCSLHCCYSTKAKVLLRTLLSRSSEECPTVEVDRLQSGEEDSQDESPVESIPIRETKAYQLLKQSATQERQQSSGDEEEEDLSGINYGYEVDTGRVERSSHQDPYPWREKTN
ncbi:hypothetical protein J4Q44_G00222630 [Coregonus suidteri]|uniref:Centrosomal protein kizuna n=1 Tax=Coregonus suidteri TaxID=861788 RepID=A0AAN8QL55_9TELE